MRPITVCVVMAAEVNFSDHQPQHFVVLLMTLVFGTAENV